MRRPASGQGAALSPIVVRTGLPRITHQGVQKPGRAIRLEYCHRYADLELAA
jgi:hypothetical protein